MQRAIIILDKRIKRGDALCSPAQTRQYLRLHFASEKAEVFCCLFLDNRNRVIEFKRMFHGTIDGASVSPVDDDQGAVLDTVICTKFTRALSDVCQLQYGFELKAEMHRKTRVNKLSQL